RGELSARILENGEQRHSKPKAFPRENRQTRKQLRIPPPPKDLVLRSDKPETWRKISASREPKPHSYTSPPYTKQRDSLTVREQYKRGPFLQRELKEWMVKPSTVAASASQEAKRDKDHQNSRTNLSHQDHQLSTKRHQTKEEIIQDLNEATRLYFSCPDPTEAASRRQRVMIGNAKGRLKKLPPANNTLLGLRPDQIFSPTSLASSLREEDDFGLTPPQRKASTSRVHSPPPPGEDRVTTARIRSIIVSPPATSEEASHHHQSQPNPEAHEEVPINEGQNKVKRRTVRISIAKSPQLGPSVLRGASSKKRKLSQLKNSPEGGKKLKIGGSNKDQSTLFAGEPSANRASYSKKTVRRLLKT
ncbi:hypothetical protein HID58_088253, partial [Brassica napus]